MASASLVFDLLANDRASAKFDRVGRAASGAGGHMSGLTSKFKSLAKAGALAAGTAAVFAAKLGWDAVQAASDLNEEMSKSKVIFGDGAKAIDKWATGAADSLGQSKRQALDAASTFGIIGQKAGLSGQETVDFAKKFGSLASDMASFNNTTPEDAITAIGAAMRGESEPIRKYGVLLDDATLRAQALKMGLIDSVTQALTPQQKALAASQAILKQTDKAQGDFARTSGGLANQQRILAAQFDNVKAKLGAQLLPVAVKVAQWLTSSFIPAAAKVWAFLKEKLGPVFAEVGEIMGKVGDWVRERLIPALSQFKDDTGPGVSSVMEAVKGAFKDAQPFLRDMGNFVVGTLIPVLGKLARNVLPIVAENIRLMGKAFSLVGKLFTAVWNNLMQPVLTFLIKGIAKALDIFGTMIGALSHIPGGMFDWAKDAAEKLHHAADEARGLGDSIKKIPTNKNITITTTYVARGGPGGQGGGGGLGGTPDPGSPAGKSGGNPSKAGRFTSGGRTSSKSAGKGMFDGMELRVTGLDPGQRAFLVTGGTGRY